MDVVRADIAIIGGGLGACAAALAAARLGRRVVLTEETHWLGGQLTNQAVPPDEHPWIEEFGATATYRALREGIRDYYRTHLPLSAEARTLKALNPGNGWVSRLCHDPRVAVAVLHQMLAPHQLSGRLCVLHPDRPIEAWTHGDRVTGVAVRGLESGRDRLIEAPFFIDATPQGELLDLAGVEHVLGAESHAETGEPHAPDQGDPRDQQAITACFAMEYLPDEDHTTDRPRQYDLWRDYRPPGWPGRLLDWTTPRPETHEPITRLLFEAPDNRPWWTFRRILDRANFEKGFVQSDITVVNWPQNDYWFGPVCGVDAAEQARNLDAARQLSLSLLYWLQTEAPRPDGGVGYRGLRLRGDVVGGTPHFLILAALQGVPFVPLPYAPKVTGFVEEFGVDPPPFEGLNAGRLIALIDRAWDERNRIREKIAATLPSLQTRARENNAIAVELLRKSEARRGELASAPGVRAKAS